MTLGIINIFVRLRMENRMLVYIRDYWKGVIGYGCISYNK